METDSRKGASREADAASWNLSLVCVLCSPGGRPARSPPSGSQGLLEEMLAASGSRAAARSESAASGLRGLSEEEGATAGADRGEDSLPSWRPQPDGEASRTEEVDGTWDPAGTGRGEQGPTRPPRRPPQGPPLSSPSQDFSFIEVSGGQAQGGGRAIAGVRGLRMVEPGPGPWGSSLSCLEPRAVSVQEAESGWRAKSGGRAT